MITKFAAYYSFIGFLTMSVFQFLISFDIIQGKYVYGGSQIHLSSALRISSLLAAIILLVVSYLTLNRANIINKVKFSRLALKLYWIIPIYLALNTLGNMMAKTNFERYFFGFLSLTLFIATLFIAKSK